MPKAGERGSLGLDNLLDDKIDAPAPEEVKKIAEKTGFGRTHGKAKPTPASSTPVAKPKGKAQTEIKPKDRSRPRRKTGRTLALCTNIKPSVHEQLLDLVDAYSDREDRPVSKAEVLERAITALFQKEQEEGGL